MKQYLSYLFCMLFGMTLFSCQSDESVPLEFPAPVIGLVMDGGEISDISLYCIEKNNPHIGEIYYEYNPKVKTLKNYSDFDLLLELNRNGGYYHSDDMGEMNSIGKYELDYIKSKSLFIVEDYKRYRFEEKDLPWPDFFAAYTNGEVSITCNKRLFGEEAGTNLEKYITVNMACQCLPTGIEAPKMLYKFGEEIPSEMNKFFVKGTWLQPKYYLQFKELPTEKYDDLTLTVTLPMIREHVRDYAVAKYRGETITKAKLTEDVFKADCQIKFEWE